MRALWRPRLTAAIDFFAEEIARNRRDGRNPIASEQWGEIGIAGVTLGGKFDRIDRARDGSLAIVDYKTGSPPENAAVMAGYAMQLGLLGLIAERGGFDDIEGVASCFEYWSLARCPSGERRGDFGFVKSPTGGRNGIDPADFAGEAAKNLVQAIGLWLTGSEPFTARLHPEYAPYGDYDQLMRLDEWYGRGEAQPLSEV
jgi:ATP-dependent helicase/nuclease subunit B